ncbi:MAG: GNAT family N-acetyltransferase [Chloroflexi bacterium]|nr:GNAT family N-acetyltransferase [Chloroflexota bacterium]
MKNTSLFNAASICLTAVDAEKDAPAFAAWTQDSRFISFAGESKAPHPRSEMQTKEMLEEILKESDEKRNTFWFGIRTPDESELLGITALTWIDWANGAVQMDIVMKDIEEFGKDSAAEAIALLQNYVFHEIQMHRLSISLPAYNKNLQKTLENLGFKKEVRRREAVYRFGKRWDSIHLGILAREWKEKNDSRTLYS